MQDGPNVGKAVGRTIDVQAADEAKPAADRRTYSELPDRSGKWPRPVRVVFIAGSAAALWGLIFVGLKML